MKINDYISMSEQRNPLSMSEQMAMADKREKELKPCPFCGREMSLIWQNMDNPYYYLQHQYGNQECILETCECIDINDIDELVLKWNKRD